MLLILVWRGGTFCTRYAAGSVKSGTVGFAARLLGGANGVAKVA